jgi:hypothetical protein
MKECLAFRAMTPIMSAASRTDRRPVAGGVYDSATDTTFICWAGQHEDGYVQAFDHTTGIWSPPVRVIPGHGNSHNYPTILQASDGHVLLFAARHNTSLVLARSPRPHSVEGEWQVRTIEEAVAATYPMPYRASNGELFVFYRQTTCTLDPRMPPDTRPILFVRSGDNGRTWQNSAQLTGEPYAIGSVDHPGNLNEIYLGQLRRRPDAADQVDLVWTLAGGGPGQHRHDYFHKDIQHAVFDPATLTFADASGQALGSRLDRELQERHCKVAATSLARPGGRMTPSYIQLVGTCPSPFVVWRSFAKDVTTHVHVSAWTGEQWHTDEVAQGLFPHEMEPAGNRRWRVYATRRPERGILTYLLEPGPGGSWMPETEIRTALAVQRVELVAGFRDPVRIVATGATSDRDVSVADGDVYTAGSTD